MKKLKLIFPGLLVLLAVNLCRADDTNDLPQWLTRPLSLADALNTALIQNATILKATNAGARYSFPGLTPRAAPDLGHGHRDYPDDL
jgi:hypothetical protein